MAMNILETKGLYHDFSGLKVLFDVNLEVREGERLAVIGPNGAGKTTLFNVITGTYPPSQGRVYFKGKEVTGFPPHKLVRRGMGRSFQITSTFSRQTAFQNIRMGILSRRGIRFNMFNFLDKMDNVTKETDEVLRRINLDGERDIPASALSYGKHRSLEISMALSTEPDLVMLDEPTAGMSVDETRTAVELIRRLTEGKTVVIIEHDMDVVFSLADRIAVLHLGAILATGSPEEIRNDQAVKDAYLGDLEV
jgi:branched-chain amino acid transport system ATP-binding protein